MSHQAGPSRKIPKRYGGAFNPRSITMPVAAIVMAGILYTYSVSSIRAAKRNAQLHREADGGQLDMRRESLRRHGVLDPVQGTKSLELFREAQTAQGAADAKDETPYLKEGTARPLGAGEGEDEQRIRTQVESGLEGYKGLGGGDAVRRFREKESKAE